MKRKVIVIVFVAVPIVILSSIILSGYLNLDNMFKGDLRKVTLVSEENSNRVVEITEREDLDKLKGIFFNRFASNFLGYTKEAGLISITFHFDKEAI